MKHIVALAGGVGGAKLVLGLARILPPDQLTVIVNTGDDFDHYGLRITPDLDTVMYTLAGVVNPETGWGLAGDTSQMLDMMARYGVEPWFGLGDRDIATHLLRTQWLAEGMRLTEVTRRLCKALGVEHSLLPMTDDDVRTIVDTVEFGQIEFQEYFVKHRWQPQMKGLSYHGAGEATVSSDALNALARADGVVICPSNPLLSIGPILSVPGMRDLVGAKPTVAVTPIIGGSAVKGPAAKLMLELGYESTAHAVAGYYGDLLDGFVVDVQDQARFESTDFSCRLLVTDTMMKNEQDKIRLAREVLYWMEAGTS